eukprot:s1038_g9.t1
MEEVEEVVMVNKEKDCLRHKYERTQDEDPDESEARSLTRSPRSSADDLRDGGPRQHEIITRTDLPQNQSVQVAQNFGEHHGDHGAELVMELPERYSNETKLGFQIAGASGKSADQNNQRIVQTMEDARLLLPEQLSFCDGVQEIEKKERLIFNLVFFLVRDLCDFNRGPSNKLSSQRRLGQCVQHWWPWRA